MQIARNAPCPCGNGKKYAQCCMNKPVQPPRSTIIQNIVALAQEKIRSGELTSREMIDACLGQVMELANKQPREELAGLSPLEMDRILFHTFESPDLVTFPERTQTEPDAPIATLFGFLARVIDDEGLKTTPKGNLPRKFCQKVFAAFNEKEQAWRDEHVGSINTEVDFSRCMSRG